MVEARPAGLRERALRLHEAGLGYRRIARDLGVPLSSVRRIANPVYAERQRAVSRAAKARRTGVCEGCGATTRYNGHGQSVSRRCLPCAAAENGLSQRGHGPVMDKVVDLLADGERTYSQIRDQLGLPDDRMGLLLGRLVQAGRVERVERGVYRRTA